MILLHALPQACSLLLERDRTREIVVRSEETLRSPVTDCVWRSRPSARRQTGAARNHGKVTRHHACSTQLFRARSHAVHTSGAKAAGTYGRHRSTHVHVMQIRYV